MNMSSDADRPRRPGSGPGSPGENPAEGGASRPPDLHQPHDDRNARNDGAEDHPSGRGPGLRRRNSRRRRGRRTGRGPRPRPGSNPPPEGGPGPGEALEGFPRADGVPVLVDSHAHLEASAFDRDRRSVVERALAQGVGYVLAVGSDLETSRKTVDIAGSYPGVFAAVGVHPHEVKSIENKTLSALGALAENPKVVAVGEIGLDYHRNHSPHKQQRHWFREQVRLAVKLDRPVTVHCRDAGEDVYRILEEERVWRVGGVVHCFVGDAELAKRFLGLDLFLGAAGPIAFERAGDLREVFAKVPIERILVETDSPYLAPPPVRGKRNEPAYVVQVAEALADLHGLSLEEVARITSYNVRRLFRMGPERRPGETAYSFRGKLYLNITNRCSNACFFCGLLGDVVYKGYDLALEEEPDAAAILKAAGDPTGYEEVIFSGFGEPTLRLDVLKEVAQELRLRGANRIRLVTNGLGSRTNGRDILPELQGLIDAVSVSLQAESAEAYAKVCQTRGVENPYPSVKDFVRGAKRHFSKVEVTAVEMQGVIDVEGCERVAREELGVPFRRHAYVLVD